MYGRNRVGRFAALVCLSGVGLSAHALAPYTVSGNSVALAANALGGFTRQPGSVAAAVSRTVAAAGSTILVTDAVTVAGRAGPLAVAVGSNVTVRNAAIAIGRCLLGAGPLCLAAGAAAALYTGYRIYNDPASATGLLHDPGAPAPIVQFWCVAADFCGPTARSALDTFIMTRVYPPDYPEWAKIAYKAGPYCNHSDPTFANSCTFDVSGQYASSYTAVKTQGPGSCPAGPQGEIGLPGIDGLCPTWGKVGISIQDAADLLSPTLTPAMVVPGFKDALKQGRAEVPADSAISGPAQQQGSPVTSTTTSPTSATDPTPVTKTTVKTPQYSYGYSPDGITVTEGGTTVTTNPDGTTSTETTGGAPAEPSPDLCALHPEILACAKLGDAPTDAVSKTTKTLTYSTESVVFASGCPAPTVIKAGLVVEWAPICDTAGKMRPYILVGAALSALMLLVAGVRQI